MLQFNENLKAIETGNPFTGGVDYGIFIGTSQCKAIFLTGTEEDNDPPVLRLEDGEEVDVQRFLGDFLGDEEAGRDYYSSDEQESLSAIEILVPAVGIVCAERAHEVGALQIGSLEDLGGGPGPGEIWRLQLVEGEAIRLGGALRDSEFLYVEDDLLVMYANGGLVAFEGFFSTDNATVFLGSHYGISSDITIAQIDPRASDQEVKLLQVATAEEPTAPGRVVVADAERAIEGGDAVTDVGREDILAGSGGDDSLRGDAGDDRLSEGEVTQGHVRNRATLTMDTGDRDDEPGGSSSATDPGEHNRYGNFTVGESLPVNRYGDFTVGESLPVNRFGHLTPGGSVPTTGQNLNGWFGPMITSNGSDANEPSPAGNGSAGAVISLGDILDTSTEPEVATAAAALDQIGGNEGDSEVGVVRADTSVAMPLPSIDIASVIGSADDDPSNGTPAI